MAGHGGDIYRRAMDLGISPEEIIDFSSNINLLGPPESLKGILNGSFGLIKNYPDPEYSELRKSLAHFNRTEPLNIIPGNGATELIHLVPRALKPARALIVAPTFSEYAKALSQAGTESEHFMLREEDNFRIDIDSLIREMDRGYRFMIICNPNNPTGNFIGLPEIERIAARARELDITVMVDESFIEFMDNWRESTSALLAEKYPNLIVLRSMTKFFAIPGLRLGYLISHDRGMIKKIISMKEPWTVNIFADLSAGLLLNEANYIKESVLALNREREILCSELGRIKGIKFFHPEANFILIKILTGMTSAALKEKLLGHRILIRDASNFRYLDSSFVRIAVRRRDDNMALVAAMGKCLG